MYVQCRVHNSSPLLSLLDEFSPSHPIPLFSILILSPHLRLCLPINIFPSTFPTKPFTHLSSPLACHLHLPYRPPSFYHPNINICLAVQVIQLLTMLLRTISSYPFALRHRYPPQHPILKYPQPTFLPECDRPSFTPT